MHYRAHWRLTFDSINALQAFYCMPKLFNRRNILICFERERETVYANSFGKIKVTNVSVDRQGELIFKLSHSLIQAFLQISICGNALTVSEFQCRSLQKYRSYDMSGGFNICILE